MVLEDLAAVALGEVPVEAAGAEAEARAGVQSSSFPQRSWMPSWTLTMQEWTPVKQTSKPVHRTGSRRLVHAPWREGLAGWGCVANDEVFSYVLK